MCLFSLIFLTSDKFWMASITSGYLSLINEILSVRKDVQLRLKNSTNSFNSSRLAIFPNSSMKLSLSKIDSSLGLFG